MWHTKNKVIRCFYLTESLYPDKIPLCSSYWKEYKSFQVILNVKNIGLKFKHLRFSIYKHNITLIINKNCPTCKHKINTKLFLVHKLNHFIWNRPAFISKDFKEISCLSHITLCCFSPSVINYQLFLSQHLHELDPWMLLDG